MSEQVPPSPRSSDPGGRTTDDAGAAIRTFLIADVRGYTRFTQERGDEAAAKLAAKFAGIARKGVEARGGEVIELRGDEALAVFTSARQAIRAALYLQELFLEESIRDPSLPLLVGIGLDAGEAVAVESGYRGGALNLAARLCAIARPGEVLASGEVTHLARRTEGVRYEHRGPVRLKGLTEPVVAIRVVSEENDTAAQLAELGSVGRDHRRGGEGSIWSRARPSWRRPRMFVVTGVAIALVAAISLVVASERLFGDGAGRTPPAAGGQITACQLAVGRLNDQSFNEATNNGLTGAATQYGINVRAREVEAAWQAPDVLRNMVAEHCDLIVVSRDSQDALIASARANPTQKYALLDPLEAPALPNVLGIAFDVDQSAFLAGYLAAGVSKTGIVATFGAVPIATVIPFMDGFAAGVLKYDADHKAHVTLLGWDAASATGTFISEADFSAFYNPDRAHEIAVEEIAKGADVIFPVAGPFSGSGAAKAASERRNVLAIGVDVDSFFQSPQYANVWLTSVRKRFDITVKDVIGLVVSGRFQGGTSYEGTLRNGGVDIAPFHDLDDRVPAKLKDELEKLSAAIQAGSVSVNPRAYLP